MSCRHDLALGTCTKCYPATGKIDPGPEEEYEENLEGPGAVTAEEHRLHSTEKTDSVPTRPDWTLNKNSSRVWREDDATTGDPDHETLGKAWRRLYGVDNPTALETHDDGDGVYSLYPRRIVTYTSYPGNDEIRILSRKTLDAPTRPPLKQVSVQCGQPRCTQDVHAWSQCPVQVCPLNIGYCSSHGGRSRAEDEMKLHVLECFPKEKPTDESLIKSSPPAEGPSTQATAAQDEVVDLSEIVRAPLTGDSFETFANYFIVEATVLSDPAGKATMRVFGGEGKVDRAKVVLTINGVQLPFLAVLRRFHEDWERVTRAEAVRLLEEKFSNHTTELFDLLDDLKQRLEETVNKKLEEMSGKK
jgi:hypothetical protein